MDYMEVDKRLEHNFDSAGVGGNRFATILLYMTDLGERDGGETVFSKAWPPGEIEENQVPLNEVSGVFMADASESIWYPN